MKYQKIINLLGNTPKQLTKFRTKAWAKTNDDARNQCQSQFYQIIVIHIYIF